MPSLLETLALRMGAERAHDALTPALRQRLRYCWEARARPLEARDPPAWLRKIPAWGVWRGQLAPPGEWLFALYLAGRASGKTLTGSNWVVRYAREHPGCRMALVGATSGDARRTMVKGKSGILRVSPPWFFPRWYYSDQQLIWPNGSMATLYTADEPARLNGPEHDAAWADEIGVWKSQDAWDMLMFTMRGGHNPRVMVTTTPKDSRLLDALLDDSTNIALTIGATSENAKNLPPAFLNKLTARYGGTHLGRQELGGELISNVEGALWTAAQIQSLRVDKAPPLRRIVVAVDPASMTQVAMSTGRVARRSDLCGISVCGVGEDEHGYVLADMSLQASPDSWARVAIKAFKDFKADLIVYETNHGGPMVGEVFRSIDPNIPITGVEARRGKFVRAEPVAALYEQLRMHHVARNDHSQHSDEYGHLAKLEDQMCRWTPKSQDSPDRLDAMVYAIHDLMLADAGGLVFA